MHIYIYTYTHIHTFMKDIHFFSLHPTGHSSHVLCWLYKRNIPQ